MVEILIVDDEQTIREILADVLQQRGFQVFTQGNPQQGFEFFLRHPVDMVVTDLCMPGMSGIDLLRQILEIAPLTLVMVMTGFGSIQEAVTAMKLGAVDFIEKPFMLAQVVDKIEQILQKQNLPEPNQERTSFGRLIGNSKAMQNLYHMIEKVAISNASVLILGESGTGKDLVAQEIHAHSLRSELPFVVVNCAALVATLLEDELFGHAKGAFTGAQMVKRGRFELAHTGTLFLDEIAEIPVNLQTKLLRVLQERAIERVGSTDNISIDVRFLAATNRNITELLANGQFREDLYYRLNVITLKIPPLRERKSDISLIAQHYLNQYAQEMQKKMRFAPETLARLQEFSWPGNVRQLQNIIHRGVILADGEILTPRELGEDLEYVPQNSETRRLNYTVASTIIPDPNDLSARNITERLQEVEKKSILQALDSCNWNQTQAARQLGLKRTVLQYKMKKYGIKK